MNTTQRFLRRLFLIDNLELLLRESKYHRDNDEEEDLDGQVLWERGNEEGQLHLGAKNDNPT